MTDVFVTISEQVLLATVEGFTSGSGGGGDNVRGDLASTTGAALVSTATGDTVQTALTRVLGTGPIVIVVAGQSNALGAYRSANPAHNPASPKVKVWDNIVGAWGSSNLDSVPMSRASPGGSSGGNNYGVAAAHYLAERTGRPVYMIMDATGGTSIDAWTATGITSLRYAALRTTVAAALAALPGKTTVDLMIWAQGEEDALLNTFAVHVAKLTTLNAQLRAETWMQATTPVFLMGMSGLHDRYPIDKAIRHYCAKVNENWVFVSMKGLPTNYDLTGAPDYTHFTGESLWAGGYERVGPAYLYGQRSKEIAVLPFWSRGGGELTQADQTAIATFAHLVSWDSRDLTTSAINAHAAVGSIAWGEQCVADGNYTFALGYQCVTDNASNWTLLAGRELTASAAGDFAGAFGYQNAVNNTYTFAAGRNHIIASSGAAAVGVFSAVTTDLADPAMFQVGVGTTTVNRSNALTVYKSGIVDCKLQVNVAGVKILGTRGAAVADAANAAAAPTQAEFNAVVATLNALLARVRAHGLIA